LKASLSASAADARIAALWTLFEMKSLSPAELIAAMKDSDASVRRNAAAVAENSIVDVGSGRSWMTLALPAKDSVVAIMGDDILRLLGDSDAQVQLAALRVLATVDSPLYAVNPEVAPAKAIVSAFLKSDDDFQRSAAVAAASRHPSNVISAALDSADAAALAPLVTALTQNLTETYEAAKLVVVVAEKPASVDPLKRSILEGVAKNFSDAPEMTPELSAALGKLLDSGVRSSALPLAAKWDKSGALKERIACRSSAATTIASPRRRASSDFATPTRAFCRR
jgi:hypothetical protein